MLPYNKSFLHFLVANDNLSKLKMGKFGVGYNFTEEVNFRALVEIDNFFTG